jgi:hypothetical protein
MNIKLILLLLLTSFSIQLAAQQNGNINGTADLDIPNFIRVYNVTAIGGEQVETYKNNSNQYFYNPLILVDWNNFKEQLNRYNNQDDFITVKLLLKISHYNKEVNEELKMLLERDEQVKNINLSNLPYSYFVLKAKIGTDYIILNPTDLPTFSTIGNFQPKHMISSLRNYIIEGNLKDIKDFYNYRASNENLKGSLYTGGFEFSSDYIKGTADFANSSKIKKNLFGDGELKDNQIVKSVSNEGGLSLSLGPLKLGGGKVESKVWTENERKRIINRNYISDLISNNRTEIKILSMGDADKIRDTKNQIMNYILDKVASQVTLEFEKVSNDEYNLIKDNINYATLKGEQVEKLLKSKPQRQFNSASEQSGSFGGASGSNKDNIISKGEDDITWQYKGAEWIPTKVEMYILSNYQLEKSFSIDALSYNKEGKKIIDISFIYPAAWLENNSSSIYSNIVDRDNPIGTILAFAGDIDKIPAGWKLCDGDNLPIHGNEEVFNTIGYNWGREKNGNFNIPDLRGAFLRGVDNNRNLDKEPKRKVGSYQSDSFISHSHPPPQGTKYYITEGSGGQLVGGGGNVGVPKETGFAGSDETRPVNFAVNFIIRIK